MNFRTLIMLMILAVLLVVVTGTVYTVKETERAIKLRFGAVTDNNVPPGLHFKWPLADEIRKFDGRVLTQDALAERYYTLEKKPLDRGFLVVPNGSMARMSANFMSAPHSR